LYLIPTFPTNWISGRIVRIRVDLEINGIFARYGLTNALADVFDHIAINVEIKNKPESIPFLPGAVVDFRPYIGFCRISRRTWIELGTGGVGETYVGDVYIISGTTPTAIRKHGPS
jgi:hypothetical protein